MKKEEKLRYIMYAIETATGPITSRAIQQPCAFRRAVFCYFEREISMKG